MRRRAYRKLTVIALLPAALGLAACGQRRAEPNLPSGGPPSAISSAQHRAVRGGELYTTYGCSACHSTDGQRLTGPTFRGLAGSTVRLADGRHIRATPAYLARSIQHPDAQTVAGYRRGLMRQALHHHDLAHRPDDVRALVEFIQMIGPTR